MGRDAKFKQLRKFYRAREREAALAGGKLPGDMGAFVDSFMRPEKYARTIAVLKAPETRAKSGRKWKSAVERAQENALSVLEAGDTVMFQGGETFTVERAGTYRVGVDHGKAP